MKHSIGRPFKCKQCNKTYKTRQHLNQHVQNIHEKKQIILCDHCEKDFQYNGTIIAHLSNRKCNEFDITAQSCNHYYCERARKVLKGRKEKKKEKKNN